MVKTDSRVKPQYFLYAWLAKMVFAIVSLGFDRNVCKTHFNRDCSTEERWVYDWNVINMLVQLSTVALFTFVGNPDQAYLRRLVNVLFALVTGSIVGLIFTGSQAEKGLMDSTQMRIGLALDAILVALYGAANRSDGGVLLLPKRSPWQPTNFGMVAGLLATVAMTIWFFDVAVGNGFGFYLKDGGEKFSAEAVNGRNWFLMQLLYQIYYNAFSLTYNTKQQHEKYLKLTLAWQFIFEVVVRVHFGNLMTDSAVLQGTIIRMVLVAAIGYSIASGNKEWASAKVAAQSPRKGSRGRTPTKKR